MDFKKAIEEARKNYEEIKRREEEYCLKHAHDDCYVCEDCEKKIIKQFLEEIGLLPVLGNEFKLSEETIQKLTQLEEDE